MIRNTLLVAALAAALFHPAAGAATAPADLPPAEAVARALDAQPSVRRAEAEARAALAERDRLRAGEYEFGLNLTGQRRDVSGASGFMEWSAGIERGLRLPGKTQLDSRIGEQGVLAAHERIADARHESARHLIGLWYDARKARLEAALWREQAGLLAEQRKQVDTRVRRGDAARLDLMQVETALAQAEAQALTGEARAETAAAELRAAFPELPAPDAVRVAPSAPEGDAAAWRDKALEHNHELLATRHDLDRIRLQVERSRADRLPDPTFGLHVASEADGDERIVGLGISVPIPGGARAAQTAGHAAQAEAQAERLEAVRRSLVVGIESAWRRASAGVNGWQRQEEAAGLAREQAELAARAYALGEFSLADTLLTRRSALDAGLAAGQAALDANEAIARLLLDAHALWPLERDEHAVQP